MQDHTIIERDGQLERCINPITPATERHPHSDKTEMATHITNSSDLEAQTTDSNFPMEGSKMPLDEQDAIGKDPTFESLAFVDENADWVNFLMSELDGGEAQAIQTGPFNTFMNWSLEPIQAGSTENEPLQRTTSLLDQDAAILPDRVMRSGRPEDCESNDSILPALSSEDQELIKVDLFGHFKRMNSEAFSKVVDWYSRRTTCPNTFIPEHAFHTFIELYFEHFAEQFDFIHPSMLEDDDASWILLLAVAAIGSQFSVLTQAPRFATALQELLYKAVDANLPPTTLPKDLLSWAQIILLRDICLVFGGGKQRQIKHMYGKNTLITLCCFLSANAFDETPRVSPVRTGDIGQEWRLWIALESRNRLFHTVYYFECLQFVFLQVRPSIDLSEWSKSLPADAALWKRRTADGWAGKTYQVQERTTSFKESDSAMGRTPVTKDIYLAKLRYIYIYVEENLARERLLKWPVRQFLPPFAPEQRQSVDSASVEDTTYLYQQVAACVQARLQTLYSQDLNETTDFSSLTAHDAIFPLLSMLRHFSLRTLYAFSGWQARGEQVQAARMELRTWMNDHPISSRRCLYLAATVFSLLRAKTTYACYDPLAMLIAALFIWTYDQLAQPPSPLDKEIDSYSVLRLDRKVDLAVIRDWVHHGGTVRLHVTGVGVLDGVASPLRTLHELKRVLSSRLGWPTMCHALADTTMEVIQGRQPRLT